VRYTKVHWLVRARSDFGERIVAEGRAFGQEPWANLQRAIEGGRLPSSPVAQAVLNALKNPKRKIMDSSEDKRPALSSPRTEPWGDMSKMTAKELREKLKERGYPHQVRKWR